MITNIWLKPQPKKKISYPNCWPQVSFTNKVVLGTYIFNSENEAVAIYSVEIISRIEFKPD